MPIFLDQIKNHNLKYRSFLEDKTVAIIGPASSVLFEENGDEIDKYDVLIRINRGSELVDDKKEFVGSRTDVLYNSLDFDPLSGGNLSAIKNSNIKFICCPYSVKEKTFSDKIFEKNDQYR